MRLSCTSCGFTFVESIAAAATQACPRCGGSSFASRADPSKPRGVCWCDCHLSVDDTGRREFKPWPRFDDAVALATACGKCKDDHTLFVTTGRDWLWDKEPTRSGLADGGKHG